MENRSRTRGGAAALLAALVLGPSVGESRDSSGGREVHAPPKHSKPAPSPARKPQAVPAPKSAPSASDPDAAPAPAPPLAPEARPLASVIGNRVASSAGEDMGRMVDVLVSEEGVVRAAVIDFGGFLGVGSRKIAVAWSALHFAEDEKRSSAITVNLTRAEVTEAPEYKEGKPVVLLGAPSVEPQREPRE